MQVFTMRTRPFIAGVVLYIHRLRHRCIELQNSPMHRCQPLMNLTTQGDSTAHAVLSNIAQQ